MTDEHPVNGSAGRFARIERKLDDIMEDVTDIRVRLAIIETKSSDSAAYEGKRVSEKSYKWMLVGIGAALASGPITLLLRLLHVI